MISLILIFGFLYWSYRYFDTQMTEKYSTAMCYQPGWSLTTGQIDSSPFTVFYSMLDGLSQMVNRYRKRCSQTEFWRKERNRLNTTQLILKTAIGLHIYSSFRYTDLWWYNILCVLNSWLIGDELTGTLINNILIQHM